MKNKTDPVLYISELTFVILDTIWDNGMFISRFLTLFLIFALQKQ